jgi:adenosylhomocysteine nucleosidase
MKHVGILCALPQEVDPFKRQIRFEKEGVEGGITYWVGRYDDKHITLIQSGMGKVYAAVATQFFITQSTPDAVFSCGTAGSLADHCQIGDLVVGEMTAQHDYGFMLPETFVHFGLHIRQENKKKGVLKKFPADTRLLECAKHIVKDEETDFNVFYGPLVSGDQVIFSSEKRQYLREQFRALAVDMESAAIAQVCMMHNVPFLAIRGISDHSDESILLDLSKIDPNELAAYSSASWSKKFSLLTRTLLYFSQHPSAFKLSLQTRQNMKRAAHNSANFTLQLLQKL